MVNSTFLLSKGFGRSTPDLKFHHFSLFENTPHFFVDENNSGNMTPYVGFLLGPVLPGFSKNK
jgi:hypothetical protein